MIAYHLTNITDTCHHHMSLHAHNLGRMLHVHPFLLLQHAHVHVVRSRLFLVTSKPLWQLAPQLKRILVTKPLNSSCQGQRDVACLGTYLKSHVP
jgi:hypothetical protein